MELPNQFFKGIDEKGFKRAAEEMQSNFQKCMSNFQMNCLTNSERNFLWSFQTNWLLQWGSLKQLLNELSKEFSNVISKEFSIHKLRVHKVLSEEILWKHSGFTKHRLKLFRKELPQKFQNLWSKTKMANKFPKQFLKTMRYPKINLKINSMKIVEQIS